MRTLIIATLLLLPTAAEEPTEAVPLFDGETLSGWKVVNPASADKWSVVDGAIVSGDGKSKIPKNTFLATTREYEDFEFTCKFRITGDHETGLINSGIQYRSIINGKKIVGYQADIGKGYWGDIYDEHRRGKLVAGDISQLEKNFKEDGWNTYRIRCKGNLHELFINGVKTAAYIEKDADIPGKGVIALQIHSGGNAKVEFKDITIKEL